MSRLEETFDLYNLTEQAIVYVEISFAQKDKKLLSEFYLDKPSYMSPHESFIRENKLNVLVSVFGYYYVFSPNEPEYDIVCLKFGANLPSYLEKANMLQQKLAESKGKTTFHHVTEDALTHIGNEVLILSLVTITTSYRYKNR